MAHSEQVQAAWVAIDAANREDPTIVTVRGETGPKEILHAELMTTWLERLRPDASDALLVAARGHHLRRWTVPRSTYPSGRAGYLKWRKQLHNQHATELGAIMQAAGFDDATIAATQSLVRKDGLNRAEPGADVQILEDALCLVFLETQFTDLAARLDPETLPGVIVKTVHKMSPAGVALIGAVPLGPGAQRQLAEALARDTVQRYLDALAAFDWAALASTLAPNVHRIGPYGDEVHGDDTYAAFLQTTVTGLSGYALEVVRIAADGGTVTVELHETVDDGDGRLRTDECVVFDVTDSRIARVAVYLRASTRQENGD
jgi:limonene-1,2-epoxide hydrolase